MPALGWAASGRELTARTRSMASSIATGPTLQLQPITSAPHSVQPGSESFRVGTIQAVAVFVNRDLRHQWNFGSHILGREHGLMQLFEIPESFQDQQIDAALGQGRNLLAEGVTSFLERRLAQRLNSGTQRANRSRHPDIEALGSFPGQPRPCHD